MANFMSYENANTVLTAVAGRANEIEDMIGEEFSESSDYAVDDIVTYEGKLYKFTSAHSAGSWDSTEVTQVTVSDFIPASGTEVSSLTDDQLSTLVGLF